MGQQEILSFLKEEREKGNDDYFTINELKELVPTSHNTVGKLVYKLNRAGFLDWRVAGDGWSERKICFRIKKKYCEG